MKLKYNIDIMNHNVYGIMIILCYFIDDFSIILLKIDAYTTDKMYVILL